MKRLSLFLALALVSLLSAREEVKMGAIWSLTGPLDFLGEQMRDGALLRMRELNSPDNNNLFDYTVIFEDDQGSSPKSVLAYKKLVNVDKVDVVFDAWAGPGNAIAPLAAKDKVIAIACSWDDSIAADDLAFIHLTPPAPQGDLLAEVLSGLGYKNVAVFCLVQQGFMAMEEAFSAKAGELGLEVKTIKFNPGERDFRGHILKLGDFEADAYVVLSLQPEFEILVNRIRAQDDQTPITAVEGYTYLSDLTAYAGTFFVEGNQPTDEFRQYFEEKMGKTFHGFVGNGYDMIDLTIYAYETAGKALGRKPTPAEAAEVLRNLKDYPSAIGSLSADAQGVFQSPAVLKYINADGSIDVLDIDALKEKMTIPIN